MIKKLLVCVFLFTGLNSYSQITVTGGFTAQQLASYIAGPNVTVFNATITGASGAFGKFNNAGSTNLGVSDGVTLSSGSRTTVLPPNSSSGTTTSNNTSGDALLTGLAGTQTFDAAILQFQFQVQTESIEFNYVFASEEYNEYAPPNFSTFNDVFAFYISGPGISGQENIALIPNTSTIVSIDNINAVTHWQYFVDNSFGNSIGYDGFTTLLKAKKTGLIPCQTYTLRLSIADAGDDAFDSGVFLQQGSLVQGTVSAISNTIKGDSTSLEGCTRASFTFSLNGPKATDTQIKFGIGGNAINGVDYTYIDSIFTIPAGQTSATIFIDPLNDGITEGQEVVKLIYSSQPCATPDTVFLYIEDTQPLSFQLSGTDLSCNGDGSGQIQINASGGFPAYTYSIVGGQTYTSTPITGLDAGTYTIRVDDSYGCKASAVTIGSVFDAGATFLPDGNGQSYSSSIVISGFGAAQTLTSIDQLVSICAELEHSSCGEVKIELIAPNGTTLLLKQSSGGGTTDLGEPVAKAPIDGANSDITPGKGYDYCWTASPTYGTMMNEIKKYKHTYVDNKGKTLTDFYLPSGSYQSFQSLNTLIGVPLNGTWTLKVTDTNPQDNGYIFNWGISLKAGMPDSTITLTQPVKPVIPGSSAVITKPTCSGSNGSIDISVSGTTSPYTYLWSNGATTQDLTMISAGSYILQLTDNKSCTYDTTFLVANQSAQTLSATHNDVSCPGGSNGSINLTVSGGTSPYTYLWSNGAVSEDLSNLLPGTYSVTVTDQNGCKALYSVDVLQTPALSATSNVSNETCGNENGTIDLTMSGGTSPYTYTWSNGSAIQDLQFLQAGTYSVLIKDLNNCSISQSFTLINEVNNCVINCNLAIGSVNASNETCGGQNGSIDISISSGVQPYSYLWSNGATTQDLSNLSAGTYSVIVTDVNNCQVTGTYTINNNTGNLSISTPSITNETCGNAQGAINITVSGGAMPYVFNWSNGKTTEDINGLSAGTYTLILRDANNCSITASYTVVNNAGTLVQTYGSVFDEFCGNNRGSIDIGISGGSWPYTYAWSDGESSEDILNLNAGTYTCVITDGNNCKITTPSYIVKNNAGTLAIFDIDIADEICGNGQGRINIDMTGGKTPYTYSWSSGQSTKAISPVGAGTYTCLISDQNGCSVSSGALFVLNSSGTLSLDAVTSADEICNNNLGSVDISVSGGSTPYTYLWNTGASSEDVFSLNQGSYSCLVTDANGCKVTADATVNNTSGSLAISNKIITNESCGNSGGAIDLFITGGTNPLSYNWSNGAITQDLTGIKAGTYTCTVSDAGGCQVNTSATVLNPSGTLVMSTPAVTNEVCGNSGGSINITVSGGTLPYSFLWSNGASTEDINGLVAGTYSCQVTDGSGCKINTGNITINNSAPGLIVSLNTITNETCGNLGGAININVSGGTPPYNYSWSNGAISQDITGLTAGTYTVTVGSSGGCSITKSYTVTNGSGTLSISTVVTDETCGNSAGAINLTVNGGASPFTYAWSNGAVTEDLSGLSAGSYSCTVTDNNGCSTNTGALTLSDASGTLVLNNIAVVNAECNTNNGQIDVNISGGTTPVSYAWSNGEITQDLINLAPGNYTCTITDNSGCSLVLAATVMKDAGTLNVVSSVVTNSTCGNSNGAINLTIGGGTQPYSYLWSDGSVSQDISGLAANTYTCIISDINGCSVSKSETVGSLGNLAVSNIIITDESCNNNSGKIDITVTGGSAPYSFAWSNGQSSEDIVFLNSGTYTCIISEGNGCSKTVSATVANNSGTLTASAVTSNTTCGKANGSINLTVSGGTPNYFYSWSNGKSTQDISNLTGGNYTCTISDQGGCVLVVSSAVSSSTLFSVADTILVDPSCGSCSDGAIDITVSANAAPPVSYSWSTGSTNEDISNLSAGSYTVTITDGSGCKVTEVYNLSFPLGIIESSNDLFSIYPNPLTDRLYIKWGENAASDVSVEISNIVGEVVYKNTTLNFGSKETKMLGLDLSNGTYMVTIRNGNQSLKSKIIVIK
jgi:subtilisin-like proprotein convertase family protein